MPLSGYFYRCFYIFSGSSGSDWFYVAEQEPVQLIANSNIALPNSTKNFLSHDLRQKIIKQVVSDDSKKVKRKHLFTERDKGEVQSCTVLVENLPEDYSHQP